MSDLIETRFGYAREASEPLRREHAPNGQQLKRFTVFTVDEHNEPSEELDFDATNEQSAALLAVEVLKRDYQPGLRPVATEERFGYY